MAQIIVRNLDEAVVKALKDAASRRRVSLEQHLRNVLADAADGRRGALWEEAFRLRSMIGRVADDSTGLIRDDRDNDEPYR